MYKAGKYIHVFIPIDLYRNPFLAGQKEFLEIAMHMGNHVRSRIFGNDGAREFHHSFFLLRGCRVCVRSTYSSSREIER